MADPRSVPSDGLLPDERVRETLRNEIHIAINVKRYLTREALASASAVNIHTIDSIIARSPHKHRKIGAGAALSIAVVLGPQAVNRLLALIGYGGGAPLDEAHEPNVHQMVACGLQHFSTIAIAAADGRIDHTEAPLCREAADMIIATVTPLSSAADCTRQPQHERT